MSDPSCPRPATSDPFQLYVLERLDHLTEQVAGMKGAARLASTLPGVVACAIAALALLGFGRSTG